MLEPKKALAKAIADYDTKIQALKADMISQIESLPDNPRINRIGDRGNCFVMSSKDLGDNWTPEYHDFKWQYNKIVEWINKFTAKRAIDILEEIVRRGSVRISKRTYYFHPDVVAKLTHSR